MIYDWRWLIFEKYDSYTSSLNIEQTDKQSPDNKHHHAFHHSNKHTISTFLEKHFDYAIRGLKSETVFICLFLIVFEAVQCLKWQIDGQ